MQKKVQDSRKNSNQPPLAPQKGLEELDKTICDAEVKQANVANPPKQCIASHLPALFACRGYPWCSLHC